MGDTRLVRLANGMEGITQADQRVSAQFVCQQARHAPTHGLATHGQAPCDLLSHLGMNLPPATQ
ncbi:hypothetical protein D3C80_1944790 [compost metagenome]